MTFANETIRHIFHKLPTETQVSWQDTERVLSLKGQYLHVIGVTVGEGELQIIVSVHSKLESDLSSSDS